MDSAWILCLLAAAAALYASVGHGGASAYLAILSLAGLAPAAIRPTALVFNVAVSLVATVLYARGGHFRWSLFWPFAAVSIPMAWMGGLWVLSDPVFKVLLACALAWASLRFLLPLSPTAATSRDGTFPAGPGVLPVLAWGSAMGLLSGMLGVGGGIFLTPLLLLAGWADARQAAAVSAPFILVNSLAGLAARPDALRALPEAWPWALLLVVAAGWAGSAWGSGIARIRHLRAALGSVLLVASAKLLLA